MLKKVENFTTYSELSLYFVRLLEQKTQDSTTTDCLNRPNNGQGQILTEYGYTVLIRFFLSRFLSMATTQVATNFRVHSLRPRFLFWQFVTQLNKFKNIIMMVLSSS